MKDTAWRSTHELPESCLSTTLWTKEIIIVDLYSLMGERKKRLESLSQSSGRLGSGRAGLPQESELPGGMLPK